MRHYSNVFKVYVPILVFAIGIAGNFSGDLSAVESKSPFSDAVAFWQFADLNDSNGANSSLTTNDKVQIGIELSGAEKSESLVRGGDGRVARFSSGGFFSAQNGANNELRITGKEITFGLRVKCAPEVWRSSPIISRHGGHEKLSYNIYCLDDSIATEVGTTGNKTLLRAAAPRSDMRHPKEAVSAWHDVYCRVNEAKLELFIDGRCYGEDFVVGELRPNDIPFLIGAQNDGPNPTQARAGFVGEIDYVAIWNRALSNDEITTISGGATRIDARERTDRGNGESLQYWLPPNGYGVGDCMPFYAEGTFHFMYLLDKGRHSAKNGFGAHQWIQATSTDLVHWKHQPFVVPIDRQNEGSICTGSVFFHDGVYYAFYANRSVEYTHPADGSKRRMYGLICVSTSRDGIHFEKQGYDPLFLLPDGYGWGARDPVVFQDPKDKKFHMYITTGYKGKGCWAHAVSDDLKKWKFLDPIYTHKKGEPECPDWFEWGGTYYLIANHLNGYYRTSQSANGPWDIPDTPNVLLNGIVNVPKTAPFGKDRRIICGWTREQGFGGHAIFHELIRHADGTLGEKFVPEMIPSTGPAVISESLTAQEKEYRDLPGSFRMRVRLEFDPNQRDKMCDWTVRFGDKLFLKVVFSERAIYLDQFKMERVDLLTGRIDLDLIVTNGLADLCVNNDRTVTAALPTAEKRTIKIVNEAAPVLTVKSLEIAPVKTNN